jgi:hypothetical protein
MLLHYPCSLALCNLCFVHTNGGLLHRFDCHFNDGKLFCFPMEFFTINVVENHQVHMK